MSILKKSYRENKKREGKVSFLGLYIPNRLNQYINLYSNAKGITKTTILKKLLYQWCKESEYDEDDLIQMIGHRAFEIWRNPIGRRTHFNTFRANLMRELNFHGMDKQVVEQIIEILNDKKEESGE